MSGRIFPISLTKAILDGSRKLRSLSDLHCHSLPGFEPLATPQLHLHLPEVWAPAQYLIDMGLRPALARRLSNTYMNVVARYRETCQSHFDRASHGGHLTEYNREVFIILFKRTVQAWDSQIVSIARVQLCQAGQATVLPERVDIRVDDAAKAEIIAKLGLKTTHLTSDKMVRRQSANVTSRLEEVSEQAHALSTNTVYSCLMLPESPLISPPSRRYDPFSQVAPQTCFPAPYPPPPASFSPRNAFPTSFIPPTRPRDVQSSASHSPDMSSLTNLFGRMTTAALETDSRRSRGVFCALNSNEIKPFSPMFSPGVPDNLTKPQLASVESIASPTKLANAPRRRKIASLPTRRGKTSASPSPPVFDSAAGATPHPITPLPTERVVEESRPDHVLASPHNTRLVPTLPSLDTAEVSYAVMPKLSAPRQRKVHTLHKTLPPSQTVPQNRALTPLATARGTFSYTVSRSPPLVSDATSYFDSPPTSSDELDTPPSTPPLSYVLLAHTSTESLAISSESGGILSYKEPLGDAKLPNPRQRYRRLDFVKGGLGRDEQPLTFTFSV